MALQGHIQELSEKHRKLEELIEDEMAHPDWDKTGSQPSKNKNSK